AALAGPDPMTREELAWRLAISPESFSWRLFNLGLIGEAERLRFAQLSSRDIARHLERTAEQLERDRSSQNTRPPMRLLTGQLDAFNAGQATLHPVASL